MFETHGKLFIYFWTFISHDNANIFKICQWFGMLCTNLIKTTIYVRKSFIPCTSMYKLVLYN